MKLDHIISAWTGHRAFADWLVRTMQPETTVDLGVDYGYSTFALAEHNPGTVYGVDMFEGERGATYGSTLEQAQGYCDELGLTNVVFIKDTFENVARTWTKPIDILHIDGTHTTQAVTQDYKTWSPFVREGGVILFHDTDAFPEVGHVVRKLPGYVGEFRHSAGLGILCTDPELTEQIKGWLM